MAEMRVLIEGMFPTGTSLPVSGTLTTTPSGTQNVSIVSSPATVPVSGTVTTTPSSTQNVAITSPSVLPVYQTFNPAADNTFAFSIADVAGVAAANNFISVFNPIGSGKLVLPGEFFISSTAAGGTAITTPMRVARITTATVGTLQAVSTIAKAITASPDPVAEVRTGNPTVTLGASIFNSPPVISATVSSTAVHTAAVPPFAVPFTLVPGEGIVIRTDTGDTDQRWNISVLWTEA